MKTHERPGDVSFRIIHSGFGNPTCPLARFLVSYIRAPLLSLSHLYGSSDCILKSLQACRCPSEVAFYRFDIEDFYMQGSPPFHVSHAFNDDVPIKAQPLLLTSFSTSSFVFRIITFMS